jgi:hypothetical protein
MSSSLPQIQKSDVLCTRTCRRIQVLMVFFVRNTLTLRNDVGSASDGCVMALAFLFHMIFER